MAQSDPPDPPFNQPLGGNEMPRFAGPATLFRLPTATDAAGLDIAITGVPLDIGTSNRPGARFGPRAIRAESVLVRPYGMATGAAPFDSFQIADVGDVALNTFNLSESISIIEAHFDRIAATGAKTLSIGGDHTITLPILRALAKIHGPVALVHVDAHADINDEMFGERITHGTIFRRAIEEGLIDPTRMTQIGLRATGYHAADFDWSRDQSVRVVPAEDCWYRSLTPLMEEVRTRIGTAPVYLSFDIDGLDPSVAPGQLFGAIDVAQRVGRETARTSRQFRRGQGRMTQQTDELIGVNQRYVDGGEMMQYVGQLVEERAAGGRRPRSIHHQYDTRRVT